MPPEYHHAVLVILFRYNTEVEFGNYVFLLLPEKMKRNTTSSVLCEVDKLRCIVLKICIFCWKITVTLKSNKAV